MSFPSRLLFLFLLLLLVPAASGQTLYAVEGGALTVDQYVGVGACGTPNGPFVQVYGAAQLFPPCPPLMPFVPPPGDSFGDVAVDHDDDRVWATDGIHYARYAPDGLIDAQFLLIPGAVLPGPATGLGYDTLDSALWVTNGDHAAKIAPGLSCTSPTVFMVITLFGIIGMAQDIEYDSCTDTLWVVTDAGVLMNYTVFGAVISVTPLVGICGLTPDLTGLGLDTTNGTFFVTDGFMVAHVTATGAAGPPEFYFPDPCETIFPGAPAPVSGLAFSLRPARRGMGCDAVGGAPFPTIRLAYEAFTDPEQSVEGNATFSIGVKDATPFSDGFLVVSTTPACAPAVFKGCPLYVLPPFLFILPPAGLFLGAAGDGDLVLGLPAVACAGALLDVTIHAQWLIMRPAGIGGWETSDAIAFTLGEP